MSANSQVLVQSRNKKALFDEDLPTLAKTVYMTLEALVDEQGTLQSSHVYLAKILGVCRRTVIRHVALLEKAGYVVVHRARVNSRVSNVYKLVGYVCGIVAPALIEQESHTVESENDTITPEIADLDAENPVNTPEIADFVPESHTDSVCLSFKNSVSLEDAFEEQEQTTTCDSDDAMVYYDDPYNPDDDPYTSDELPTMEGLSSAIILKLVAQSGFSLVMAVIKYAEAQKNLTNPPGFVIRATQGQLDTLDLTESIREIRWRHEPGMRYITSKYADFITY